MKRLLALVISVAALGTSQALAWGPEGHVIVAMVAEDRLQADIKQKVRALLSGAPLATAGIFADEYRLTHPETARWHYVDVPFASGSYDEQRDCVALMQGDCILKAIDRVEAVIADLKARFFDRADALKFLVHFVGDLHQPFHGIERPTATGEGDQGGNLVKVKFFEEPTNLHSLWDSGLILHTARTAEDYAAMLEGGVVLAGKTNEQLATGTTTDWAIESHDAAKAAYVDTGADLAQPYFDAQIETVDTRLALGGARLAAILTRIFGPIPLADIH